MKSKDWIALIEAGYNLEDSRESWLENVLEHAAPLLGRGFCPMAAVYDYTPLNIHLESVRSRGPLTAGKFFEESLQIKTNAVGRFFRDGTTVSSLSEAIYVHEPNLQSVLLQSTDGMVKDKLAVKALTGKNSALIMCWLFSKTVIPTTTERNRWSSIASHLAAGLRLRALTKSLTLGAAPVEAVFTPDGRLHDARQEAKAPSARRALREAVRQIEKVRTCAGRRDPDAAMEAWEGLVQGRWSLVDHFDTDQQRFIIAIKNDLTYPDPRGLTIRERQIAEFVGLGQSSKEICYTLGVSHALVTNCTASVQKKLGLVSRAELAAFFAPSGLRKKLEETLLAGEKLLVGAHPLIDERYIDRLTEAERAVLAQLVAGSTNGAIAKRRNTSDRTVANQIQSIFRKFQVSSRSQLIALLQNMV